ncbi:MAG TPA: nucleotide exchange factor GrpE [Pyrinomonadaceae bacterium]|nr:nucleotide exchange factor GrpE [Pyrinomonadaceae bacterium]
MTSDKKERKWGRIPIRFADTPDENEEDPVSPTATDTTGGNGADHDVNSAKDERDTGRLADWDADQDIPEPSSSEASGPVFAELIATRAELKRLEAEANDLRDKFARRQADFENFRKRLERERSETHNRVAADLVTKLLPVLDNLGRALDTEASVEATESDEFRHFLSGVDLIYRQLGGVLETMGVKPVAAVGQKFDPHVHEAVVTEETDEHDPDTVMQEIVRGYKLGEKLLRPALVKVAVKK